MSANDLKRTYRRPRSEPFMNPEVGQRRAFRREQWNKREWVWKRISKPLDRPPDIAKPSVAVTFWRRPRRSHHRSSLRKSTAGATKDFKKDKTKWKKESSENWKSKNWDLGA
jgi:hypothetical protein